MDSSGSKDTKSVPKFGSFKLPTTSAAINAPDQSERGREHQTRDRNSRSSNRRRGDHRHDDRSRSPRLSPHRRRRRSPSRRSHPPDARSTKDHQDTHDRHTSQSCVSRVRQDASKSTLKADVSARVGPQEDHGFFVLDRKGDRHNLMYGPGHRHSIPSFRRAGSGVVMGDPGKQRIDRASLTESSVVLRSSLGGQGSSSTRSKRPLSKTCRAPNQVFRIRKDETPYAMQDLTKDFMALNPAEPHNSLLDSHDGSIDDRPAYRSRDEHGVMGDETLFLDEDAIYAQLQVDIDEERKGHHAALQRDVKEHPTDIASWLRLIDYQEIMIRGPREDSSLLTLAERQGLADVKLSLYEKALKKVGNTPHRDRLLLGRLEEGSQLWDPEKLLKQWDQTLLDNPGLITLWVKYINFRQTELHGFTFKRCLEIYFDSFALSDKQKGPRQREIQCYIFLRLTLFLRESGFTEVSVGLWQAVLEFTCCQPAHPGGVKPDKDSMFHLFGEWWESEVPRIGELGAKGWGSNSGELDSEDINFEFKIDPWEIWPSWALVEREHIVKSRTPARSVDGTGCVPLNNDEAHKVVLLSDLRKIVPAFWDLEHFDELLDAFLFYCHLPHITTPDNVCTTRLWNGDSFLRNEYLDNICFELQEWKPQTAAEPGQQSPVSPFAFKVDNFLLTTDTLFARPNRWFSSFRSLPSGSSNHMSIIDYDWVRRALRLLVNRFEHDDELAEYALALEFAFDPKKAKLLTKTLVKKRPGSLRLWNAYALIVSQAGDQAMANEVFRAALSNTHNVSPRLVEERGLIWHSWIWDMLDQDQLPQAAYLIYGMSTGSWSIDDMSSSTHPVEFSVAALRAVERTLAELRQQSLDNRNAQLYVSYTDCLGLWYYLTEYPLASAFAIYTHGVGEMRGVSSVNEGFQEYTTELLHQAQARFIYFIMSLPSMQSDHMHKAKQARGSQLRDVLKRNVLLFPNNTMFLALYMWTESRLPHLDRIRGILDLSGESIGLDTRQHDGDLTLHAPGRQSVAVSTHLFSIFMEICRPTFIGASPSATRAAFERAIGECGDLTNVRPEARDGRHSFSGDNARSSLTVWKLYFLWELYNCGSTKAAKAVFWRAIRACPWSKEIFMLAFEHLLDNVPHQPDEEPGFQGIELQQLYNTMSERQLRIFTPIEHPVDAESPRHTLDVIPEGDNEDEVEVGVVKDNNEDMGW